jgi:hypothetical protein
MQDRIVNVISTLSDMLKDQTLNFEASQQATVMAVNLGTLW